MSDAVWTVANRPRRGSASGDEPTLRASGRSPDHHPEAAAKPNAAWSSLAEGVGGAGEARGNNFFFLVRIFSGEMRSASCVRFRHVKEFRSGLIQRQSRAAARQGRPVSFHARHKCRLSELVQPRPPKHWLHPKNGWTGRDEENHDFPEPRSFKPWAAKRLRPIARLAGFGKEDGAGGAFKEHGARRSFCSAFRGADSCRVRGDDVEAAWGGRNSRNVLWRRPMGAVRLRQGKGLVDAPHRAGVHGTRNS